MKFNQNLEGWNVSNVKTMEAMFGDAKQFDGNISTWNVSKVENMKHMFWKAKEFNQDIGGWDVSKVVDMEGMFKKAVGFNQDISGWDISSVENMKEMFDSSGLSSSNFDSILNGWAQFVAKNDGPSDIELGAAGIERTPESDAAVETLEGEYGWTIECNC